MEFDRFSTQSFEQLAQALAMKVLGAGTVIFGAGPDGGREATFEGQVPFPSATDMWQGYTVVQAKCRERLRKDQTDVVWLEQQIQSEFVKYQRAKRKLRKPQNFLLITNVYLTSVPQTGGKDRIDRIFHTGQGNVGFSRFAIWGADEIRALLDDAPEIRKTYAAWLTPGDILDAVLKSLSKNDVQHFITLALSRDLREERDARLRDAGQEPEKAIYLEDVFIDLPLERKNQNEFRLQTHDEGEDEETASENAVYNLIMRSRSKLDPDAVSIGRKRGDKRSPLINRIVILGGPGQGKSTIGQFFAQYLRAQILRDQTNGGVGAETIDIMEAIACCSFTEELPSSVCNRYPIRVDLPKFADFLTGVSDDDVEGSLLHFISKRIAKRTISSIDGTDVREWIGKCPTAVILDGLDEVPPSGNRKAVIKAINCFWDEVALVKGDCLVLVTSRPQGYNGDLHPEYWEHWRLSPLSPAKSIQFASKLSLMRISDPERRDTVMNEINKAITDTATRSLMTSPLQVSIIFGIALLKGAIPHDRWDLFNRYYTLLRDREAAKPGPISTLFRDHKTRIDLLHYQAGYVLQVAAEVGGKADAYLTTAEFRTLVERQLEVDEYSPEQINFIANDLVHLATQRLVLLVTRVEGRIAFEVRFLQEFMAAAQITSMSPVPLAVRLRA